jgi:hypothetical protein
VTILILPRATDDLVNGFRFYEEQAQGLGSYFRLSLFEDVAALRVAAGVHARALGYHRSFSKKFPFAIYYNVDGEIIRIHAILDCRRNPQWIRRILDRR